MTPQQTIEQAIEALKRRAEWSEQQAIANLRALLSDMEKAQEPLYQVWRSTDSCSEFWSWDDCDKYDYDRATPDNRRTLYTTPPLPQREGWKPIETAPRDGTPILAFTHHDNAYVVSYDDCFSAPWRIFNDQGLNERAIIYWMPLPAAPKPTEDE